MKKNLPLDPMVDEAVNKVYAEGVWVNADQIEVVKRWDNGKGLSIYLPHYIVNYNAETKKVSIFNREDAWSRGKSSKKSSRGRSYE